MTNPSHGSRRFQGNVVFYPLLGTHLEGRLFSDLGHAGRDTVVKPATTIKETTPGNREIIVYSLTVGQLSDILGITFLCNFNIDYIKTHSNTEETIPFSQNLKT